VNILVTGGAGVIGVRVVRKLLERGIKPVVFDFRPDYSLMPDLEGRFEFVTGDVTRLDAISAALRERNIERIVHLAAFIDPDMGKEAFRSFAINTGGTVNMLEAARLAGIRRFVYASSRAVYGITPPDVGGPGYRPLTEDHEKRPVSAYDVTKLAAEQMGRLYRNLHGIEFAALRFAGIYGPGKQARHGKMSLRSRMVEDPVAGKPVRLDKGGEQLDDIIYVDDVAESLVLAALAERLNHEAYNIASGRGQTLRQFADAVRANVPGADIEVGPGLNPMGFDVHYYAIMDISRAKADFGYAPRFGFVEGVRDYVESLKGMRLGG
jgi:UDP-glucose 4-epimerase